MEGNDVIEQMLDKNPLLLFSTYTQIQTRIIRDLGQQIINELNVSIRLDQEASEAIVNSATISQLYGRFWLWVIGSYEITRTMCQANNRANCFSATVGTRLQCFKQMISPLRMAFAKQEYADGRRNQEVPVQADASIAHFDGVNKDLGFQVKDKNYSVRACIEEFEEMMGSIQRLDVLRNHRQSYAQALTSIGSG